MLAVILSLSQALDQKIQEIQYVHARIDRINHRLQIVPNCPTRQAFYDSVQLIYQGIQKITEQKNGVIAAANLQNRGLYPYEEQRIQRYDLKLTEYRELADKRSTEIKTMKIEQQAIIKQDKSSVRLAQQQLDRCYLEYATFFSVIICLAVIYQHRDIPTFNLIYHGTPSSTYAIPLLSLTFNKHNANASASDDSEDGSKVTHFKTNEFS